MASLPRLAGRAHPPACGVKGWSSLALLLSGTGSCRLQAQREGTHTSGIRFWKRGWWERGVWGAGALPVGQVLPGVASGAFMPAPVKPRPPRAAAALPLPGVSISLFIGGVNYHVQFFSFQIILYLFKKSLSKYKEMTESC